MSRHCSQHYNTCSDMLLTACLCHGNIPSTGSPVPALQDLRSHPSCREETLSSDHLDAAASMLGLGRC